MKLKFNLNINKLLKRTDIAVAVIIVTLGVVISVSLYNMRMRKITTLKNNIKEEKEKNDLLVVLNKLEGSLNAYRMRLKKKDASVLINKITDLSRQSNIRINSLTPVQTQERDIFVKVPISVSLEGTYHQLGNFISALENSADFLRVESLSISVSGRTSEDTERIGLVLNSIYLK